MCNGEVVWCRDTSINGSLSYVETRLPSSAIFVGASFRQNDIDVKVIVSDSDWDCARIFFVCIHEILANLGRRRGR